VQHLHPDPDMRASPSNVPANELVKEAIAEARHLIQLEIALAKEEAKRDASGVKLAAIALGLAVLASVLGLSLILVAVSLAIFPGPLPAVALGLILMGMAALAAVWAVMRKPKRFLMETRRRLDVDLEKVKERVS
jgi:protein-S-isoprenylcysteine O-methyltransferase Ste14